MQVRPCFFKPEIEKNTAKDAAECVVNPTKENIEKLKLLLQQCPTLLFHSITVYNRHRMPIKGTVYQIALHESDHELIDDVIKPGFNMLKNGIEEMEAQRKNWLPEGWLDTEERTCASACLSIDNVFTAFKNATDSNDVTESPYFPCTITINHEGAKAALEAFRKAIDILYQPTTKVITSGRDPIIRLLERVINRYEENFFEMGGYDTPRNNALLQKVFGYCQRVAPINFMQAFAQEDYYYTVKLNKKLNRSVIFLLDSDPTFRLGYEYFVGVGRCGIDRRMGRQMGWVEDIDYKNFLSIKNSSCFNQPVLYIRHLGLH